MITRYRSGPRAPERDVQTRCTVRWVYKDQSKREKERAGIRSRRGKRGGDRSQAGRSI